MATWRPIHPIGTEGLIGLVCVAALFLSAAGGPASAQTPAEEPQAVPMDDPAAEPVTEEAEIARADLSLASEAVSAEDYARAEEILAGLEPDFPDDPALLLMRGGVLLALGQLEEARRVLEHGVEVGPNRPRMQFQLATTLASMGERDGALEAFRREIEVNPDPQVQILAHLNRSMLLDQKRRWSEAAVELEAVLVLAPDQVQAYGDLASLYIQAGDTDAALDVLDRGREAGFSSAQHYYSLAARLFKSERLEDAARMFEQALVADPGLAAAERSLGYALERLGRKPEAVEHLKRYLELRPDAPDAELVSKRIKAAAGS